MSLWCVPCGRVGSATPATCTVDDEACCANCGPREALAAGVDAVPLKGSPTPALPAQRCAIPKDRRTRFEEPAVSQSPGAAVDPEARCSSQGVPAGADNRDQSLKEESPTMSKQKLSARQIEEIRSADSSVSNVALAKRFGVTDVTIHYHRNKRAKVASPPQKKTRRRTRERKRYDAVTPERKTA